MTEEDGGEDSGTDSSVVPDRRTNRHDGQTDDVADASVHSDADADARRDSNVTDAKNDKAETSFPTGSPCGPVDKTEQRPCGICGVQFRVCAAPEDAGEDADWKAADAGSWQEWGDCLSELDGGCAAGSTDAETCGMCGSRSWTCGKDCRWTIGDCKDAGVCYAGSIDYFAGLSCDGGKGRERACDNTCQWQKYGECEMPGTELVVSGTPGGFASKNFVLVQSPDAGAVSPGWGCPSYGYDNYNTYESLYVELKNPAPNPVTASVWTAYVDGGVMYPDLYVTTYPLRPDDTDWGTRLNCEGAYRDYCYDRDAHDTSCQNGWPWYNGNWGGLMKNEGNAVQIPANSSVWVYILDYNSNPWHLTNETYDSEVTLSVKTEAVLLDAGTD